MKGKIKIEKDEVIILVKILEWMKENRGMWNHQIILNFTIWIALILLFIYMVFK